MKKMQAVTIRRVSAIFPPDESRRCCRCGMRAGWIWEVDGRQVLTCYEHYDWLYDMQRTIRKYRWYRAVHHRRAKTK